MCLFTHLCTRSIKSYPEFKFSDREKLYSKSILSNAELEALSPSLSNYSYVMLNLEIELGVTILDTFSGREKFCKNR